MKFKSKLIFVMLIVFLGNLTATPAILNYMDMNGDVGVSYYYHSDDDTSDADVILTDFNLGLSLNPSEIYSAYLGLLYSSDMNSMYVDEAYATMRIMESYPLHITAGQFYMPTSIDSDYSNFISDPLTYQFAEMQEVGLMADYAWENLTFKTAFFKEVQDNPNDDTNIDAFVFNVTSKHEIEEVDFVVNGSFISNLASTNFPNVAWPNDGVGALTIGATANWRQFNFLGEFLMALDEINEEKPSVMHVEAGYDYNDDWNFAAKLGMSMNAEGYLPETVFGAIANYTLMKDSFSETSVSAEYVNESSLNMLLVKLNYNF